MALPIPLYFCWTKFGVEAGESVENILQRKEQERKANGGVFLWGIGNALGPSLAYLLKKTLNPEVIFSPIRSAPKKFDVAPSAVVSWAGGEAMDGTFYDLPSGSVVTSRASGRAHYALVCKTQGELRINMDGELIKYGQLRNLRTGRPLGYSQVTSVVMKKEDSELGGLEYPAAIRVELVYPYFIKLLRPIVTTGTANKAPEIGRRLAQKHQHSLELA